MSQSLGRGLQIVVARRFGAEVMEGKALGQDRRLARTVCLPVAVAADAVRHISIRSNSDWELIPGPQQLPEAMAATV